MSKPNTIQQLYSSGDVTMRDVDRIASSIFEHTSQMHGILEGYVVHMPDFDDLPDTCKQFIRKALMSAKVQNVLDAAEEVTADHASRWAGAEVMPVAQGDLPVEDNEPGFPQDR